MIRFVNMNVAVLALTIAVAFGNYHVKEEARRTAKRLTDIDAAIAEEDLALRTLDAEWSYLNEPSRIQELAQRHLRLSQIKPSQVLAAADMAERLPLQAGARPRALATAPSERAQPLLEPEAPAITPASAQSLPALDPQR